MEQRMTVGQIARRFNVVMTLGLFIVAALVIYLHNGWAIAALVLYFAGLYFAKRYFKRVAWERLLFVIIHLLDPVMLEKESNDFMKLLGSKDFGLKKYADVFVLYMQGHFEEAIEGYRYFRFRKPSEQREKDSTLFLFYLRANRIEDAQTLLNGVEKSIADQGGKASAHDNHRIGLYFFEIGELHKARTHLEESLLSAKANNLMLALHYDLARLEEKEGNPDKAIEHYKQAAAIGPKTWMGQEAARRAEALAEVLHPQLNEDGPKKETEDDHADSADQAGL